MLCCFTRDLLNRTSESLLTSLFTFFLSVDDFALRKHHTKNNLT